MKGVDVDQTEQLVMTHRLIMALVRELLPSDRYSTIPTILQVLDVARALGPERAATWIRNWASDADVAEARRRDELRR